MRTALVTGGAKGIGEAIAKALANDHGMQLVLWGRDERALMKACDTLATNGTPASYAVVDMGDMASVQTGLDQLAAQEIAIDVLINNAGILTDEPLLQMADTDIVAHIAVNALGPLRLIRALAPSMTKRGYGRIVNVSSGWGSFNEGLGPGAYGISKALLNAITVKTAAELPAHITVNAACPGWVRTQMGGPGANRSVEDGADTPVWLATLQEPAPTGQFFRNRKPIKW